MKDQTNTQNVSTASVLAKVMFCPIFQKQALEYISLFFIKKLYGYTLSKMIKVAYFFPMKQKYFHDEERF